MTFFDSRGLGAPVSIRNAADAAGRAMTLRIVSPGIVGLLELTGLRDAFTLLPEPIAGDRRDGQEAR